MVLMVTNIPQQLTATSAGAVAAPQIAGLKKDMIFLEDWNRETLNPTNAIAIYTAAADGAGTNAIFQSNSLLMTTGTVAANDNSCYTAQMAYSRTALVIDSRSQLEFDFSFRTGASAANIEWFVGLTRASTAPLTNLPTTEIHLGVYGDTSVNNVVRLTSGNGTAQSTTSTTLNNSTNSVAMKIRITGNDNATIDFYNNGGVETTSIATHTVTSLGIGNAVPLVVMFWVRTEVTAAKTLEVFEWGSKVT